MYLSDHTDKGDNYTVTIQEINVIISAFQTYISTPGASSFNSLITSTSASSI